MGHRWLGHYGTGLTAGWTDERVYHPVPEVPYTPARHFVFRAVVLGTGDPGAPRRRAAG